jgi:hypothetical protein
VKFEKRISQGKNPGFGGNDYTDHSSISFCLAS